MEIVSARRGIVESSPTPSATRRKELVALTDSWIQSLYEASGADPENSALVAVGGYGKGDLCVHSDLDLFLLYHTKYTAISEVAEKIWYPIWDSGIKLDHSVRTVAEARRLAGQDLKVVLGLLDARTVAGNNEITQSLRSAVLQDWRALAPRRLDELKASVSQRTQRSGELAYLLEPDLKESYGGLRDATILRAIAASWVTDTAVDSIEPHVQLLLNVRDALHQTVGKAADKLMLQDQGLVAEVLGFADSDELLRAVSAAGRAIAYASNDAWYRVTRVAAPKRGIAPIRRLRPNRPERAPLADGVVVQDGEAVLAVDARPDRDPVLALRAAAAAAQAGLRLSRHTVTRLAEQSPPLPEPWPVAARDALISLLGAGKAAIPVWEALDQAHMIEGWIPEWSVVRSAPQRNPVHRFTVDRHLVETAVNASTLTRAVSRPDLLLTGALLHDIGKGQAGDHTEVGVKIVTDLAPRMGFDPHDSQLLVDMVKYHLLLPDTATRRDLSDPVTVAAVAEQVQTPLLLELLDCLTRADAAATGPAAWSRWKESLIDDLVRRTRAQIAGHPDLAPPILTESQQHLAHGVGVEVQIEKGDGVHVVTVAAEDRIGLLAVVAGVLAIHRLAVRSARTQTFGSRAVTVWTVQPEFGEPPEVPRLREDVRVALEGGMDIAGKLRARAAAYQRSTPVERPQPRIDIVADASATSTVLEVRTHDIAGLLHTVAAAIASVGISINAAQVSTLGSEVIDVFYLIENTTPLDPPRAQEALTAVRTALTTLQQQDQ